MADETTSPDWLGLVESYPSCVTYLSASMVAQGSEVEGAVAPHWSRVLERVTELPLCKEYVVRGGVQGGAPGGVDAHGGVQEIAARVIQRIRGVGRGAELGGVIVPPGETAASGLSDEHAEAAMGMVVHTAWSKALNRAVEVSPIGLVVDVVLPSESYEYQVVAPSGFVLEIGSNVVAEGSMTVSETKDEPAPTAVSSNRCRS